MRWAFRTLTEEHRRLMEAGDARPPLVDETAQVEWMVPERCRAAHRTVRELGLPPDTLIVLVRRAGRAFVPRGEARIEPGDELLFVCAREQEAALRARLAELAKA
ncbi:MAG: hypothetical protein D6701_12210 [Gemmatimonadetes bacterium]|nr:MAG: hypothetical protein D6701_12210 [Gemmatimonadota bacterium]